MKKFLKVAGLVLLSAVVVFMVLYLSGRAIANSYINLKYESLVTERVPPLTQLNSSPVIIDSLEKVFGQHKIIPEEYRSQILLALSFYPQLKDTRIEFLLEPAVIPISSRPKPATVFYKKSKRWYCIVISSGSMEGMEDALLENLSFEAQVGVIGHELGHTVFYKDRSSWDLIGIGIAYPFNKFRQKFEKETDVRTIEHGLGWQLLKWAEELRPPGSSTEFLDTYYLRPEEIRKIMEESSLYQENK